jgi:DNA-binding response OmpR family regulator
MEKQYRAVLIESHYVIRTILTDFLTDRGYEVHSYDNPKLCPLNDSIDCRCSDRETCCDLIVIDIDLPVINGLELVQNIKEKSCKCPNVLLISDVWPPDRHQEAQRLNCKTLTKPFEMQQLIDIVSEFETRIMASRELRNWIFE